MKKQILIGFLFFASAVFHTCSSDSDAFIVPMEEPDTSLIIQDLSISKTSLESGGDTSLVSATVLNASGNTVEGIKVIFEVSQSDLGSGTISYPDDLTYSLSDSLGSVTAYYTSPDENYGDFQIIARTGTVADSLMITVIPVITSIQVAGNMSSIIGDGESTVQVSLRPISTAGNVADLALYLTTDYGYFDNDLVYTDSTGFAYGTLHSIPTGDDLSSVVRGWVANSPAKRDSVTIQFLGVHVQLTADSNYIQSSGDSTRIVAFVSESSTSNPIPNKIVNWSTTLGSIGSQSVTNSDGEAESYLSSNGISGSAQISATIGNGLAGSIPVIIVHSGAENISLSSTSNSILANGVQSVQLTAIVTDGAGSTLDGIGVSIDHSFGTIEVSYGVTNSQGIATFELLSGVSSLDVGTTVTGSVVGNPGISDSIEINFRGISISVIEPDPNVLVSDGTSVLEISANVFETTSLSPISNEIVDWTTSLGTVDSPTMTDAQGNTFTILQSEADITGIALVRGFVGDMQIYASTSINIITMDVTDMTLSAQFASILADGLTTDSLTVTATDNLGSPVEDANIRFTTDAGLFSNNLQEIQILTDANGLAKAVLKSQPGVSDLLAHVIVSSVENPSVSETTNIMFRGITITVNSAESSIIANGYSTTLISGQIKETSNGNPLVDETVTWATSLGVIESSSTTNSTGTASTTLYSQVDQVGTATITCGYGLLNPGSVTVEFLPQPDPGFLSLSYQSGGTSGGQAIVILNAILTDIDSHPILNYSVTFTILQSGIGSLSPSSDLTNESGIATSQFTYPVENSGTPVTFEATAGSIQTTLQVTLP